MKKKYAVMITGIVALLINVQAFAQMTMPVLKDSVIAPYHLAVTFYKTTNLIFPYAIKSVDRGSKDILAQKANDVDNVLQIKAAKLDFEETNLTVITADGKLYSYILNYVECPSVLNILVGNKEHLNPLVFFSENSINEARMQADAEKIFKAKKTVRGVKDNLSGINLRLEGIYINGEVMYFRIKINNQSNIDYDIKQLRFFIIDQKKSKRTATQELEIRPLHKYSDTSVVAGKSKRVLVYAVPKFTIPDKKYLAIQLMEKNGGRNLELSVHNKTIVRARLINK